MKLMNKEEPDVLNCLGHTICRDTTSVYTGNSGDVGEPPSYDAHLLTLR